MQGTWTHDSDSVRRGASANNPTLLIKSKATRFGNGGVEDWSAWSGKGEECLNHKMASTSIVLLELHGHHPTQTKIFGESAFVQI